MEVQRSKKVTHRVLACCMSASKHLRDSLKDFPLRTPSNNISPIPSGNSYSRKTLICFCCLLPVFSFCFSSNSENLNIGKKYHGVLVIFSVYLFRTHIKKEGKKNRGRKKETETQRGERGAKP